MGTQRPILTKNRTYTPYVAGAGATWDEARPLQLLRLEKGSGGRHFMLLMQGMGMQGVQLSRVSTSDFKIGTPVATLPGAWRYRVSAGTGRPGVSIL